MPRIRNDEDRETTITNIKATARDLLAEQGTAGLSLRAIARELGLSAPALYHYFASMDDIITALIVDAFNALADAIENAVATLPEASARERMLAAFLAYRRYALDHSQEFQLIYGSPIPGYEAPRDITVPASSRTLQVFVVLLQDMVESGEIALSDEVYRIPARVRARLEEVLAGYEDADSTDATVPLLYALMLGWPMFHGAVMLELFQHVGPVVDDTESYYRHILKLLMDAIGKPPAA